MSHPIERIRSDRGLKRFAPKVVYVLSGGAAKGLCHLGMIEALEKRGVMPDLIVGTSMGALVGALYSHFGSVEGVCGSVAELLASDEFTTFEKKYFGERAPRDDHVRSGIKQFFSSVSDSMKIKVQMGRSLITSSMVAEKDAATIFGRLFKGITLDSLKIPFAAVAVDLSVGAPVIFTTAGSAVEHASVRTIEDSEGLLKAAMASASIPLIFPAVQIDDHAFVDGGVMANLPARQARLLLAGQHAVLVGFDVSSPVTQAAEEMSSVELALRLLDLATRSTQAADQELVDVLFRPVGKEYPWSSFTEYEKFIDLGREHMTGERLDGFNVTYRDKCHAAISRDPSALRRFSSSARLRKALR